eukprot:scaffold521_cov226-Pinguiococcus_pyrenoidosus.AAC.5
MAYCPLSGGSWRVSPPVSDAVMLDPGKRSTGDVSPAPSDSSVSVDGAARPMKKASLAASDMGVVGKGSTLFCVSSGLRSSPKKVMPPHSDDAAARSRSTARIARVVSGIFAVLELERT